MAVMQYVYWVSWCIYHPDTYRRVNMVIPDDVVHICRRNIYNDHSVHSLSFTADTISKLQNM